MLNYEIHKDRQGNKSLNMDQESESEPLNEWAIILSVSLTIPHTAGLFVFSFQKRY
jgi:hypothetical protein